MQTYDRSLKDRNTRFDRSHEFIDKLNAREAEGEREASTQAMAQAFLVGFFFFPVARLILRRSFSGIRRSVRES